jgi:hypothetical protein
MRSKLHDNVVYQVWLRGIRLMVDVNPEVPFQGERPDNFIIGVINEQQAAESAVDELRASGSTDDSVMILHGKSAGEALRRRGEQPGTTGFIERIRNRLEEFGSGGMDDVQRHVEAAEEGNYVIGVTLTSGDEEHREGVRQILKSHGGYDIVLVGRDWVELLDP